MESVTNISLLFEQGSSFANFKVFIHAFIQSKQQPGKFYFFMKFTIGRPNGQNMLPCRNIWFFAFKMMI